MRDLDLSAFQGEVDVLAGGPPCQPFSAGGVAKGDEDKRNMFPAMFKAVQEMRPKVVICENVRGLLRPSFVDYFQYIQNELSLPFEKRDDEVKWQDHNADLTRILDQLSDDDSNPDHYRVVMVPVNAASYGVPQVRNRVVIVAFRADLGVDVDGFEKYVKTERFSEAALFRSMRDEDGPYWKRHPTVEDHVRDRVRARLPKVIKEDDCQPWRTMRDAIQGHGTDVKLPALPLSIGTDFRRSSTSVKRSEPSVTSVGLEPVSTRGTPRTNSIVPRKRSRPAFTACQAASP